LLIGVFVFVVSICGHAIGSGDPAEGPAENKGLP
jgi:hypothetical protein